MVLKKSMGTQDKGLKTGTFPGELGRLVTLAKSQNWYRFRIGYLELKPMLFFFVFLDRPPVSVSDWCIPGLNSPFT